MIKKSISPLILDHLDLFRCPLCSAGLTFQAEFLISDQCGHSFEIENGLPLLFCPNDWSGKTDVTETIKSFYEKTPFPNYEDIDSKFRLIEKAEKGLFAHLLNKQITHGLKVLEAGCGTGQLSNFLGIASGRAVFGADMCLHSLKLAENFRYKNEIGHACFLQMNLFRPPFRPEAFDLVIANGVLHHTSDPYRGFQSLLRLVKKGGFIIIGLYNSYGRIGTDLRRFVFSVTGGLFCFLDPHLRKNMPQAKKHAWFMDQYKNPHESKHSMDEVLDWFDKNNVEFSNSIPKLSLWKSFSEEEKLFSANPAETKLDRILVQLQFMFRGSKEGGLFIMIGRKQAY